MKKFISAVLALLMLVSLAACGEKPSEVPDASASPSAAVADDPAAEPVVTEQPTAPTELKSSVPAAAKSYADVFAAFQRNAADVPMYDSATRSMVTDDAVAVTMNEAADVDEKASGSASGGGDFSGTNVQVSGIDEGDIVKTDGEYIYVIRDGEELLVLDAEGFDTAPVAWVTVGFSDYSDKWDDDGDEKGYSSTYKSATEMFVADDRLVILGYCDDSRGYSENGDWHYESENYAFIDIYDISDPTAPKLVNSLGQDGYLVASRLLDGKVYAVTRYWIWEQNEDEPETYIPSVYRNGASELLAADCIYICPDTSNEYCVLCAYDPAAGEITETQSILGSGDEIYMNAESIYLMGSEYTTEVVEDYQESVYHVEHFLNTSETAIHRFDLEGGLHLAASGRVPGGIDSQFSADAYAGNLRIVTTRNDSSYKVFTDEEYGFSNYQWEDSSSSTGLYVLDGGLNVIGSVEDLAEGEYVYSARFDGEIAYFCTFRTVDPLFAVDVSDPTAPKVLSALKISGFSDYLHAWDETRLFGFGREADVDSGASEGLKLVMFDTSDKTDVKAENSLELDAYYSEALYNHKAFFIDSAKNIIGFVGDGDYYVFSYTPEAGFTELSHFDFAFGEWNVRGLWIGDYAYIVGRESVSVLDMTRWGEPETISLGWG